MRVLAAAAALLVLLTVLSGCFEGNDKSSAGTGGANDAIAVDVLTTLPGFTSALVSNVPSFALPLIIDGVRAGGEPVIAITQAGSILVSAHPGFTHYHPSGETPRVPTELVSEFGGQSYLWRSADNGTTWTHIGLPGMEQGPRSTAFGVSDPEFTVMMDGTICFTDLEALAMSSTSCSTDDGLTWLPGNPVASGAPTDRQWLASYGDEFYFTANYFTDHHIRASTDRGLTWEDRGDVPCGQDLIADPATGHLIVACGAGIAVSQDAGFTWSEERAVPDNKGGGQRIMAEPGIDSAGNIWVTYTDGENALYVAGTPDEGMTWPWNYDLTPHVKHAVAEGRLGGDFLCVDSQADPSCQEDAKAIEVVHNGTYIWPWISAGSEGRLAVTWIHAFSDVGSGEWGGNWYILSAYVLDATSAAPQIIPVRLTPNPMHDGPICQSGTTCQVSSVQGAETGDRRLGDFFETTIGPDGFLYGSWSNTFAKPTDTISHPEFVKQTGGIRLISDELLGTFVPTQG